MKVMSVWLAHRGPPAPAHFGRTGWDTSPSSLTLLDVLLDQTQVFQTLLMSIYTVENYYTGLSKSVDIDTHHNGT
jgi:hypothetical protein